MEHTVSGIFISNNRILHCIVKRTFGNNVVITQPPFYDADGFRTKVLELVVYILKLF